jgi:hypothetical protein
MEENKLKIKTLTCHDIYNFGASLQAYALITHLKKLGHDVEIIDYKPDFLTFDLWAIGDKWKKNPFVKFAYFAYVVPKRLLMHGRRKKFDSFTKKQLILTNKKYINFDELKENPPQADIFFAGSDQIWNPLLPNGKDPSFFLDFTKKSAIRASYAASFSVTEIPDNLVDQMLAMLNRLDFISVREESGNQLLQQHGVQGEVVVDPVFLLPAADWAKLTVKKPKDDYIFVYDQENNKILKETALHLAKKYNLKIYAIEALYPLRYADKRINDAGPKEFLTLIQNCTVCLTNSFHCISFSLIFNKNFLFFKRTHMKVNSRMDDLLAYLDLQSHAVSAFKEHVDIINIDYEKVDKKIDVKRKSSFQFIDRVLEHAQKNV